MSKPKPIRADWGSISGTAAGPAHATPGKAAKTKENPATVQMLRNITERRASRVFWFIELLLRQVLGTPTSLLETLSALGETYFFANDWFAEPSD